MSDRGCHIHHLEDGKLVRCGRPVIAVGLCEADYQRLVRADGDLDQVEGSPPVRPVERTGCRSPRDEYESAVPENVEEVSRLSREDLDTLGKALGFSALVKSGSPDLVGRILHKVRCPNPHHSGGHCSKHYSRKRRTGTTNRTRESNVGKTCSRCREKPAQRRGMCVNCYYNERYHAKKREAAQS
jgi:hypothetical protein